MAERRMFTKKITDDERFYMLPASTQLLYFHLSMSADDDGFCNQISVAMFKSHASIADLETLLDRRYLYQFENGVIVIKHWRMANALRKDRYTQTVFKGELAKLGLDENGAYTWLPNGCQMVADCLPQSSIDKNSIVKDNNIGAKSTRFVPPTIEEVRQYCNERSNGVNPEAFVNFYESKGWMIGKNKMKDWKSAVRTWEQKRKDTPTKKNSFTEMIHTDYDFDEIERSILG